MSATGRSQQLFAAGAFAALLAAGLVAAIASLDHTGARDRERLADTKDLWSGESGRTVARVVNEEFPLRKAFHRIERSLAWLALGDWGARVREGCPGWLFLADELHDHPGRAESATLRAQIAARLEARLESEGVKLALVIVPDKSRVESAHLCGLARAPHAAPRIARWMAQLRALGIDALDLTGTLQGMPGERYYRTDTHWNEPAAESAAIAVAARLRSQGLASAVAPAPAPLPGEIVERPGDLVRVAGLDALPAALRPAPDRAEKRVVPPVAAAADDLFGTAGVPQVVLVGTSFSRASNFVPYLARHLGEQVANAAKDGGDFDGAASAYVASPAFGDTRPKVIVWEIPERLIEEPIKPSEREWMGKLRP